MYDTFAGFADASEWQPEDGHRCVEIMQGEDQELYVKTNTLKHDEIRPWLESQGPFVGTTKPTLRLFIAKRSDFRKFPYIFALSLRIMHDLVNVFGIPKAFVNLVSARTIFTTELADVSESRELENNHGAEIGEYYGVISILAGLALAIRFDRKSQVTYAIMLGLCDHQAANLIDTMRSSTSELACPMSLALMWLNVIGETRARRAIFRKRETKRLGLDIGLHWSRNSHDIDRNLQNVDFNSFIRSLTVLGSSLSWDVQALEFQQDTAAKVEMVQNMIDQHLQQHSTVARKAFGQRLRYAKHMLRGLQMLTTCNESETRVQLQTIYCLVSQRDNEISYATAVASQRIAEAAKQDSTIMKSIAEDSKQVALRTWRDAVYMKLMAAVTLFTLPGTFTATLFSANFFKFEPKTDNSVSPWIWLYCAVTGALTALFALGWLYTHRSVDREINHADTTEGLKQFHTDISSSVDVNPAGHKAPNARESSIEPSRRLPQPHRELHPWLPASTRNQCSEPSVLGTEPALERERVSITDVVEEQDGSQIDAHTEMNKAQAPSQLFESISEGGAKMLDTTCSRCALPKRDTASA